jgi:alkanesulfonate monooxygenase SsuD/methylene tetrahydromethanopterin reductase-like flavin-dependent oxidoreductase (luciferase family)
MTSATDGHEDRPVQFGVAYPQVAIGSSPETLTAFATAMESDGVDHLAIYDHVLGADREAWPDLGGPWRAEHEFHDAFVLLGFLAAATSRIGLSTQVIRSGVPGRGR